MDRRALLPGFGLLLLSALWAVGWLLPDLLPHSGAMRISLPLGQTLLFSAVTIAASLVARIRREEFPHWRRARTWALIGLGLFVIPSATAAFTKEWISNFDQVAILCLTPIMTVVLEPHFHDHSPPRGKAAVASSLVALAGILFLFPLQTPNSPRAALALLAVLLTALCLAIAGCLAVRLLRTAPDQSVLSAAGQACGATAISFAIMAPLTPPLAWSSYPVQIYLLRLFLVDAPSILLLFWLMRHLSAARMSARFLLAPLLASVADLALEARVPSLRALLGMFLLATGAGWLLFAPSESRETTVLSLRAITEASTKRD